MVDFVEMFPPELIEKIFSYLTPLELGQACQVSKIWRTFANREFYWKNHCIEEGITEDFIDKQQGNEKLEGLESICKSAFIYGKYYHSVASNWKRNTFKELDLRPCVEHIALDQNILVQSFFSQTVIDVYVMKSKIYKRSQTINPGIPGEGSRFLFAKCNTLTISTCNIMAVYKRNDDEYKIERVIAINDAEASSAVNKTDEFIQNKFSDRLLVSCVAIFTNFLWIYDELENVIIIFDRVKGLVGRKISLDSRARFLSNDKGKVYMEAYSSFAMYSDSGKTEMSYSKTDFAHKCVTYNDNYVGFIEYQQDSNAICISLKSLNIIRASVDNPFYIALHPRLAIAYCLSISQSTYRLHAFSPKDGNEIWMKELSFPRHHSLHLYSVHIILDKYLVVFPYDINIFAFYCANTGEHLYNSQLGGPILYITNKFMITRCLSSTARRLEYKMRSYL